MLKAWVALLAVLALLLAPPTSQFTDEVWEANQDIYQEILRHPFLKGMQDGSLDPKIFAFYLMQDAYYLREFALALEATAAKAPKKEWAELLKSHAQQSLEEELLLHESVLKEYGISAEEQALMEPAPEAFAYASYIVAVTHTRPFPEALSVLLPCYWIYWEVGKELSKQKSPDSQYQKWIDEYASEDYGKAVQSVLDIADELATGATAEELKEMKQHFRRASRYEWMFWDSAYHRRRWSPGPR
ncbi:MAG: thiaminase II [Acidobacteriota bacterium]